MLTCYLPLYKPNSNVACKKACGDGVIDTFPSISFTEGCEFPVDGSGNYGCHPDRCLPWDGYTCSNKYLCEKCGDGRLTPSEICDAPGIPGANGCTTNCLVAANWTCSVAYNSTGKFNYSLCTHVPCGDGN